MSERLFCPKCEQVNPPFGQPHACPASGTVESELEVLRCEVLSLRSSLELIASRSFPNARTVDHDREMAESALSSTPFSARLARRLEALEEVARLSRDFYFSRIHPDALESAFIALSALDRLESSALEYSHCQTDLENTKKGWSDPKIFEGLELNKESSGEGREG